MRPSAWLGLREPHRGHPHPRRHPRARRIEHRVAGADANPYLVMAGILGAALSASERAEKPAAPITGEPMRAPAQLPRMGLGGERLRERPIVSQIFDPTAARC